MKKWVRYCVIALLASAVGHPALADNKVASSTPAAQAATTNAHPKIVSMASVIQQLQKAGYIIKSVEYSKDDGLFKVTAIDRQGEKQSLDINAATGPTAEQKKVPHEVTVVEAVKKLEKNGATVASIVVESDVYKASTIDNKDNQQDYTVDKQTGKVSQ